MIDSELQLTRSTLLQTEPLLNRGTLLLLPPGKKHKQKLVIGDGSGNLSCYEFKNGEAHVVFTAQVFDAPITALALGGPASKKDKIFVAEGQKIVGLTKKGREFFKLTSSLTETIHNMVVEDTKIWTGGEFIYNLYEGGQDAAFYMCHDRINHMIVGHVLWDSEFSVLLGCHDSYIRVVHGSKLVTEIAVQGPVTCMAAYADSTLVNRGRRIVLFGTDNGVIGAIQAEENALRQTWALQQRRRAAVNCLCVASLSQGLAGGMHLIAGRDDGLLEVYLLVESQEPVLVYETHLDESIRSVQCGLVNSSAHIEIIVGGYSGRIVSFTTEQLNRRDQGDTYGRSVAAVQTENRIRMARKEVEALRIKVEKEREKLSKYSQHLTPIHQLQVNSSFQMDPAEACYNFVLELTTPIDLIILKSKVQVELLDVDSNAVTVAKSQPTGGDESYTFLVTLRCQESVRRISMKLRTTEGLHGELSATIVPGVGTAKVAQVVKYPIAPLSLHHRVHVLSEEEASRPKNTLQLNTEAPLSVLREWIAACLPEAPQRIQEADEEVVLTYKNVYTGGFLTCAVSRGQLKFQSESISAIVILREYISEQATNRRFRLQESLQCDSQTVFTFLSLLRPKLEALLKVALQVELIDAVHEIAPQESDRRWLSPEYVEILENADRIREAYKSRPHALEYLSGIITDLYVDYNKLQGMDVKHRLPELQQLLVQASFDELLAFFQSSNSRQR